MDFRYSYAMITYIADAPLSELTWYKIGGKAKYLFYPKTVKELQKCLITINGMSLPFFVIGGGSNVLIGDYDFNGAVICVREMAHIELLDDFTIRVGAGALSTDVANFAYENGLEGAEFLYKLPGSIGGAAVMNARAYGGEMSDMVRAARCVDLEGDIHVFSHKELEYDYKVSLLQNEEFILYELELVLEKGDKNVIRAKMDYDGNDRISKHQFEFPCAGCTFKNDHATNTHAGKLIDELGLKGQSIGGAMVSPYHANFIVNREGARASEILSLIELVQEKAKIEREIELEMEVKLYGNFGNEKEFAISPKSRKKK